MEVGSMSMCAHMCGCVYVCARVCVCVCARRVCEWLHVDMAHYAKCLHARIDHIE